MSPMILIERMVNATRVPQTVPRHNPMAAKRHPEQEVIHKLLIVEDPAGDENKQVMHDGLYSERENAIHAESKLIDVT